MEFLLGGSLVANAFLCYLLYEAGKEAEKKDKIIRRLRKERKDEEEID